MFKKHLFVLVIGVAILSGCASTPAPGDNFGTVTTSNRYGEFNKNISISAVDGANTGVLFQPKMVQVKPGKHTIVQNIFCNRCSYDGKHTYTINVEAGHTYFIPQQFGSVIVQ